jgi:DNA mismatch repair protein MutS2
MREKPKIDIHGMTSKEAVPVLRTNLKEFNYRGFSEVHIIHGKGAGILRATVQGVLEQLHYVESFRSGNSKEGGSGVTIAILKG